MLKKFIGSIIITFGVLLLLSNYDIIVIENIWDYIWTVSLISVGVVGIITGKQLNFTFMSFIIIGSLFLIKEFGWIEQSCINNTLGPVLIIIIGITFFINYNKSFKTNGKFKRYIAVFSGIEEKIKDDKYIGSEIVAVFGGVDLDLREVKFKEKITYMNMSSIFGGVTILVPKNVKVTTNGLPIFGGVENRVVCEKFDCELVINYNVAFGGIEIKN